MTKGLTFIGMLALLLAVGPAFAQTKPIQTNIPFDFMVAEQVLPAGEYQLKRLDTIGDPNLLLMRNSEGEGKMVILSRPVRSQGPSSSTKLVFYRYGDRYFLRQVWVAGKTWGRQLPESRPEQRVATDRSPDRVAVLAELR